MDAEEENADADSETDDEPPRTTGTSPFQIMTYLTNTSLTYFFFQTSDAYIARRISTGGKTYITTLIKRSVENHHISKEPMPTTGNRTNGHLNVPNKAAMARTPLTGRCGCI